MLVGIPVRVLVRLVLSLLCRPCTTLHPYPPGLRTTANPRRCIDWQKIRVQELLGSDAQQQGRVPRTVEVELKQDLVSSCVVGDVVTVLGLVKVLATGESGGRAGRGAGLVSEG